MRLERTTFWALLLANIMAAAVVALLLPAGLILARPSVGPFTLAPIPLKPMLAFLLCLPSVWLGARRLHDVGQAGWHACLPLLAFIGWMCGHVILRPLLVLIMTNLSDHPKFTGRLIPAMILLLWLGRLLLAAGTLRTLFLWLQPGEPRDNRYGPASVATQFDRTPARQWLLRGRADRLVFWAVLVANLAMIHAITYVATHWMNASNPLSFILVWFEIAVLLFKPYVSPAAAGVLYYLPTFAAAVLRLHDRNRSGVLAAVVLAVNLVGSFAQPIVEEALRDLVNVVIDIITIYLLFQCMQPGDAETNHYGPPPGGSRDAIELPEPPARPAPAARVATPEQRGTPTKPSFGRRNA